MPRHLLLLITFIFFTGSFLCEGQANRPATKTGTLSTSVSSGQGANGNFAWWLDIGGPNAYFLNGYTVGLCLNDSTLVLNVVYAGGSSQGWNYNGQFLGDGDSYETSDPLRGFALGDSIVISKPGIYTFTMLVTQGMIDFPETVGLIVTSTMSIDSLPGKTTFCSQGSIKLNAPPGSFSNFQWYKDSSIIPAAIDSFYVANNSGNYYVQITGADNCILNSEKISVQVYTTPSQLAVRADSINSSMIVLANDTSDLYPESVTWYRNNIPIKSFNDKGIVIAGGNGIGNGLNQLYQPYGIFLDSGKNVYVADFGNARIMKWAPGSSSGEIVSNDLSGTVGQPTDLLLDSGSLYISGTTHLIGITPPFNSNIIAYGDTWGLTVDPEGNLYFMDGYNAKKLDLHGNITYSNVPSNLTNPNGLYIDTKNNLYITDNLIDSVNNYYGRIVKWTFDSSSDYTIAGGSGYGNAPNQIAWAAGITFDKHGNMYVTDPINKRVQLWKPGADHGITIASGFAPWGIKVDDSDNIYVADQTNNQVLKFPPLLRSTVKADTPGIYKAVITYPGGCIATSNELSVQNGPPPVTTALNFAGQLKDNNALLTWQTASENNTSYYNVQRSVDNVNFTTIAKVSVSGSSNLLHNYSYVDNNITDLNVSKIYYRVNEIGLDGTSALSNVVLIDLKKTGWSFTVSPNPVRSSLTVQLYNLHGSTTVSLFDMAGRKLAVQQINASGYNLLNFNTDNLSGGLYIIQVINNGKRENLKFVKE